MVDSLYFYKIAEAMDVKVDCFPFHRIPSVSLILPDNSMFVGIDPFQITSQRDETLKIAHEMGHCCTGAFYNRYSPCDTVQRNEARADLWAAKQLVPEQELIDCLQRGMELWELTEYFDTTERMVEIAYEYYKNKHLSAGNPLPGDMELPEINLTV